MDSSLHSVICPAPSGTEPASGLNHDSLRCLVSPGLPGCCQVFLAAAPQRSEVSTTSSGTKASSGSLGSNSSVIHMTCSPHTVFAEALPVFRRSPHLLCGGQLGVFPLCTQVLHPSTQQSTVMATELCLPNRTSSPWESLGHAVAGTPAGALKDWRRAQTTSSGEGDGEERGSWLQGWRGLDWALTWSHF